jgi:hypothetical protein
VTTREEAKKLDPNESFWWVGFHTVHVDNDVLSALIINIFLEAIKSRKRARMIIHEDAVRATGVWTQEEAGDVAHRLIIGEDGNFVDPKLKKGILRPLQYLGIIK